MKYINRNLATFNERLFLEATILLSETDQKVDETRFAALNYKNLMSTEKLLYLKIKMQRAELENIQYEVLKLVNKNSCGEVFWGENNKVFYNDKFFATMLALEILNKIGTKPHFVKIIEQSLFATACAYNYLNTLQRALLIGYLLENLSLETGEEVAVGFKINGEKIIDFPKRYESGSKSIEISYSGRVEAMVFIFRNRQIRDANTDEDLIKISSTLSQFNIETNRLKLGSDVLLNVKIENSLSANYAIIEIPIPAGCSYGNMELPRFSYEVYREYRTNKVVIYCKYLPAGSHNFSIALEPRFQGNFTLLPVKMEEMYFPDKSGNNAMKRIIIED